LICDGSRNNLYITFEALLKILDNNNICIDESSGIIKFIDKIIDNDLIKLSQNKLEIVKCFKIFKIATKINNSFFNEKENKIC
jgi:hypothetical protein